jgi:hypothetical protein
MVNDFHYNSMDVEQIFLVDMFEAKFKGTLLSKSTGREVCEKVRCFFSKKNDVYFDVGFRRDGFFLIRVYVYLLNW